MSPSRVRYLRNSLLACAVLFIGGCTYRVVRTFVEPDEVATLDDRSPFLKAHLASGHVYVLSSWDVDGSSISGTGSLLDPNRGEVDTGFFTLPADSVRLFETNVQQRTWSGTALTVMAGITAAVAGICAANPKTCFGSCPTYYVADEGGRPLLQAEGFSSSIAPALEATDLDMLMRARPRDRRLEVRVTNEALETHVIRHTDILAVPKGGGDRVFVTPAGAFHETTQPGAPSRCTGSEGDCLAPLLDSDGLERFSLADSTDLATREVIDLEFTDIPAGELGLVIQSRQTLMTTFLIYQALAYLGNEASRWLAALEDGDGAREGAEGIGRLLGNVEVLVPAADGSWAIAGVVGETGPLASDTKVVPLTISQGEASSPLRIRLRLTQGLWRLDRVALVGMGPEVEPVRILPTSVFRDGAADPEALRVLADREEPLVTLPGDAYDLVYELPANPEAYEIFLEARGYYLEWMRQEWLAEENPLAAMMLVVDPAGTLRSLAPAFKLEEPQIENLFWNSRYARN
ncbi:MAG: hypothetical protein OEO79_16980 [Gemmatimonadota bacterium]|nr:hypothetical protein [Gemmatimonadota bacterium]